MGTIGIPTIVPDHIDIPPIDLAPHAESGLIPEDPRFVLLHGTIDKLIRKRTQQPIWMWIKDYIQIKADCFDELSPDKQNLFLFSYFRLIYLLSSKTNDQGDDGLLELLSSTKPTDWGKEINASQISHMYSIYPPLFDPDEDFYIQLHSNPLLMVRGLLTEIIALKALSIYHPYCQITNLNSDYNGIDAIVTIPETERCIFIDIKAMTPNSMRILEPPKRNVKLIIFNHQQMLHPLILAVLKEQLGISTLRCIETPFRTLTIDEEWSIKTESSGPNNKFLNTIFLAQELMMEIYKLANGRNYCPIN